MDRNDWAVDALKDVLLEHLKDKKRARRKSIIWKIIKYLVIILLIYWLYCSLTMDSSSQYDMRNTNAPHIAAIKIDGVISDASFSASAEQVIKALQKAFKAKNTVGIMLNVNSPGGSPVQSNMIFDEILRLRQQYPTKPVYTVVSDLCASGCYYFAAASDKIIADKLSIVGSIGVVYGSFGLTDAINKLGIERRVITAGEHKDALDPFKPLTDWDKNMITNLLNQTHQQFIDSVKLGRGKRLNVTKDKDMFSGKIWLATDAKELGLIDDLGGKELVMDKLNNKRIVDYTAETDLLRKFGRTFGVDSAFDLGKIGGYIFDRNINLRYDL